MTPQQRLARRSTAARATANRPRSLSAPTSTMHGRADERDQSDPTSDDPAAGVSTVHSQLQSTQRHKVRMMAGRGRVTLRGNVHVVVLHFGQLSIAEIMGASLPRLMSKGWRSAE